MISWSEASLQQLQQVGHFHFREMYLEWGLILIKEANKETSNSCSKTFLLDKRPLMGICCIKVWQSCLDLFQIGIVQRIDVYDRWEQVRI